MLDLLQRTRKAGKDGSSCLRLVFTVFVSDVMKHFFCVLQRWHWGWLGWDNPGTKCWWKHHHFWFWLNDFEAECCYMWFFILWMFPQELIVQELKGTKEWLMFENTDRYETQTPVGGDIENRVRVSRAAQCELMKTFLCLLLQSVWKEWNGNPPPLCQLSCVVVFIHLTGVFLCLYFEQTPPYWDDEDEEEDTACSIWLCGSSCWWNECDDSKHLSLSSALGFLGVCVRVDENLLWHAVKSLHRREGASSSVLFSSANKWCGRNDGLLFPVAACLSVCQRWIQSCDVSTFRGKYVPLVSINTR